MLDPDSFEPVYHQIKVILRDRIRNGTWSPGEQIPSETQLSGEFEVSRLTVRRALKELEDEGLLVSQRGKGRFAAFPKLEQSLFRFYSLGRDIPQSGHRITSPVVRQNRTALQPGIAAKLRVPPDSQGYEIQRVRYIDDEPLALETVYLPLAYGDVVVKHDLSQSSIYTLLEQELNLRVSEAEEFLEPINIGEYEAQHLHVNEGIPGFLIERTSYLASKEPLEFRRTVIRGDRWRFYIRLT